jgi:hypothetical protein
MSLVLDRPVSATDLTWRDFFPTLEASYAAMAADEEYEAAAKEWCDAFTGDIDDEG